jgi:hypothetical protein
MIIRWRLRVRKYPLDRKRPTPISEPGGIGWRANPHRRVLTLLIRACDGRHLSYTVLKLLVLPPGTSVLIFITRNQDAWLYTCEAENTNIEMLVNGKE